MMSFNPVLYKSVLLDCGTAYWTEVFFFSDSILANENSERV